MTFPESPVVPINWKHNLAFTWISQVFSLMAFSFAMSFAAYYIQDLGINDPQDVTFWNGIYQTAAPLALAVMGPIWGILGDRVGRRAMMLRANFAAVIIILLMGCVTNVYQLIALRVCQGMFTGTITAAATMVAVTTPKERHGFALGSLQASVIVGWLAGSGLGGYLADLIGYAQTIRFGAGLMLAAALIVLLFVKENFVPPQTTLKQSRFNGLKVAMPILIVMGFFALARRFDMPFVPLLVQELNGGLLEGAATRMGQLIAVCCVAMMFASLSMGYLSDMIRPSTIASVMAVGAAVCVTLHLVAETFLQLVIIRAGLMFFIGGIEPAFQSWLARNTPAEARGGVFGFSMTAKSLGWASASMGSTAIAMYWGIRSSFVFAGILFILLIPLILLFARQTGEKQSCPATSR